MSQFIKAAGRADWVSDAGCELSAVSMSPDMPLYADYRKQRRLQKLLTKLQFSDVML
jgi:hypothetical protein